MITADMASRGNVAYELLMAREKLLALRSEVSLRHDQEALQDILDAIDALYNYVLRAAM